MFIILSTFSCRPEGLSFSPPPADRHQPYNFRARKGMVVAAHPLAAEAGLQILKQGGNAIDAAVATSFALNAAEPFASGIGGGGFMLIYLASEKKATVINFREKAPAKAFPDMFWEKGKVKTELREAHGLAVAVPGALAGWQYALEKYGTKSLAEVMQPAIEIAEKGFRIGATYSTINKDEYDKLIKMAGESTVYLNQGFPYEPGDYFRNPELARTFRLLASKGIQEFYTGEVAKKIVSAVNEKGGLFTLSDLASYRPSEQTPLVGNYKNLTLYTIPPPSSGGVHTIQLLNIVENWPLRKWGHNRPLYIHHLSEALRLVFADRARYLGDPDYVHIPLQDLTSKEYARRLARKIKPDQILNSYPPGEFDEKPLTEGNTSHLCVIDTEGNIVSQTQSINYFFGSGIIPEHTGFLLNNLMADFTPDPESLNAPRPRRRPVSSMTPLVIFKGSTPFLVLGSPGGSRIFSSLTQIILNVVEFGLSLDEAIEAPRFFSYSSKGKAMSISLERRFPESIIQELKKRGNRIRVMEDYDTYFGGAQGIMILKGGKLLLGGADSRRDGYGAGY